MSAPTLRVLKRTVRVMPGTTPRNGLPSGGYVYRGTGTDVLTPELDQADAELLPSGVPGLAEHGTDGAARRHYRNKTPLCDSCKQHERRRAAEREARRRASGKAPRAVHAGNGGRPWCGVWNIADPVIAAPGQEITCGRCKNAMGRAA